MARTRSKMRLRTSKRTSTSCLPQHRFSPSSDRGKAAEAKGQQRPVKRAKAKREEPVESAVGPKRRKTAPASAKLAALKPVAAAAAAAATATTTGGGKGKAERPPGTPKASCALAIRESELFKNFFGRVRTQLGTIRFETVMIDTYEREGWRSANLERMKPEKELSKARERIHRAKMRIRELFNELMAGDDAKRERKVALDDDGEVDASNIFCAVCSNNTSSDDNDIILCDLEGCNRAFHQACCEPVVTQEELDATDDWFCRRCMSMMEGLNEVNDELGTDIDSWEELFAKEAARPEQGKADPQQPARERRSRRGRRIVAPSVPPPRMAWDAHSFASDTDDESFASRSGGEKDDEEDDSDAGDSDGEGSADSDDDARSKGSGLVLNYKRPRKQVDYRVLAQQLFEEGEDGAAAAGEDDEDEDFVEGKAKLIEGASMRELYGRR